MKEIFAVISQMESDGVIGRYAIGGAIGAIFWLEPMTTKDIVSPATSKCTTCGHLKVHHLGVAFRRACACFRKGEFFCRGAINPAPIGTDWDRLALGGTWWHWVAPIGTGWHLVALGGTGWAI